MPDWTMEIQKTEAFEDGAFGWATVLSTLTTPESTTPIRQVASFRLVAGVWMVIQWHNSIPVPNRQIFGVGPHHHSRRSGGFCA